MIMMKIFRISPITGSKTARDVHVLCAGTMYFQTGHARSLWLIFDKKCHAN